LNGGCLKMRHHKWTMDEQAIFLKMTGELLSRGYPLADALESTIYHLPRRRKEEIRDGLLDLKEGFPFYTILSKLDFNEYLIGYVFFAEQHGGLATSFIDGSDMLRKQADDLKRLKTMLVYPCFLLITTLILLVFVKEFLIPRFSSLFKSMNVETNFFIHVINLSTQFFPLILVTLSITVGLSFYYYFFKFKKYDYITQKRKLVQVPILGRLFRLFYTHYFSTQLSYLLSGGLSISEALTLFENNEQPFYKELGIDIKFDLKKGKKLDEILRKFPFFERELSMIVKHGQENGKLDKELLFFASQCIRTLEERTDQLLKKVQPMLYVLIGFFIVSMYLAVMLPMFHLLDGI
jgi:competence protein ComGB